MITQTMKEDWLLKNEFALRRLNGKRPAFKGAFNKGDSIEDVMNWDGNLGILTGKLSGVVCLDVDVHNGIDGMKNLKQYMKDNNIDSLPTTRSIMSPTGGMHFYYKLPEKYNDTRFHPNVVKIEGLDFRNHGQFMVLEGSETEKGVYKTVIDMPFEQIPQVPDWLIELYKKPVVKDSNTGELTFIGTKLEEWSKGVTNGNRNIWLTRQVGFMFRQNMSIEQVYQWASIINVNYIKPPLDNEEIVAMINSVNRSEAIKRQYRGSN